MASGLGSFVRERRTTLGLTQDQVATAVGISRSHLSQIESGKIGLPGPETRRRLAEILAVDHLDLLVAAAELSPAEAVAKCARSRTEWDDLLDRLPADARALLLGLARLLAEPDPGTNERRHEPTAAGQR